MVMSSDYRKTFPKVPYGTWSDDGSLTLAMVDSLTASKGVDEEDFGRRATLWFTKSDYTPDRHTYDVGNTTQEAILRMMRGHAARVAGLTDVSANGNGSLMRTIPLALWHQGSDEELYQDAGRLSAVTHGHDYSKAACGVYCVAARRMMRGESPARAFIEGLKLSHVRLEIPPKPMGSGYVLDTLAYAIHAARAGTNYESCVAGAISLGGDTDTTAAVVGGLIGARDGVGAIPARWLNAMRGRDLAESFIEAFVVRRCS
jgi:ADP-ribosylglycohydrolase